MEKKNLLSNLMKLILIKGTLLNFFKFCSAYIEFLRNYPNYKLTDYYQNPGPTQFSGKMSTIRTLTLKYGNENYLSLIKEIEEVTQKINSQCRFGTHQDLLRITISNLNNVMNTLEVIKHKYV